MKKPPRPRHHIWPVGVTLQETEMMLVDREKAGASRLGGAVRVSSGPLPGCDNAHIVLLNEEPYAGIVTIGNKVFVKGFGKHPEADDI